MICPFFKFFTNEKSYAPKSIAWEDTRYKVLIELKLKNMIVLNENHKHREALAKQKRQLAWIERDRVERDNRRVESASRGGGGL